MDPLANTMNSLKVAEAKGKSTVRIKVVSTLVRGVLDLLMASGYVKSVELDSAARHPELVVELAGKITGCGVIKPRYAAKAGEWEKYEQRFLPAQGVGFIVVSTPQGLMTNAQAREKNQGGRLLAYVY